MKNSAQKQVYINRIYRVMDYVQENLHKPLQLKDLSEIANFSPYHFHRIFTAITGERLNNFIQRLRIEKAATILLSNPQKSITEVALDCGFSSSASFARLFREFFGMNASQWRNGGYTEFSKIRETKSNIGKSFSKNSKEIPESPSYFLDIKTDNGAIRSIESNNRMRSRKMKNVSSDLTARVDVKNLPDLTVAYVRHIGPYKGDGELFRALWDKLFRWAGPRGLTEQKDMKCLNVYHDNPEITDENNLRTSVCISVPEATEVSGEIGKMNLKGGKYAVAHFEINVDQYEQAWTYVYGTWLPESGYQPDDRPCFELCLNNPEEHPEKKHIVDIYVPVIPL